MRNVCIKALVLTIVLAGTAWLVPTASGQTRQQIFNFNQTWRYYQAGAAPAGTWTAANYSDAAWSQGGGVLGFDASESLLYNGVTYGTMSTVLNRYIPGSTTTQVLTYYFRTSFNFSGNPSGVTLILTNLLDDGAVIYLNGVELGRFGMPGGTPIYTTAAVTRGGDEFSGRGPDVLTVTPTSLVQGNNVIAVEVHQTGGTSSDLVFGMSLTSILPSPLTITSQPQSVQATAGDSVTFSVTATGAPINYQWRKDGVNISGATNSSYSILGVNFTHAGNYTVRVYNSLSDLTSSNAVLTVFQDTDGPIMMSANVQDTGLTNLIDVLLDEPPLTSTANTNNIRLVRSGTFGASAVYVVITNATVSGKTIRLRVGGDNWVNGGNYYVIVNGLTDAKTNYIAPNSVIGVSWPVRTKMAEIFDQWSFYDSWFLDTNFPAIYNNTGNNAWFKTNYVEDPILWAPGNGTFYRTTSDPNVYVCAGDPVRTQLSISSFPVLFRRNFTLPAGYGTTGTLNFRHVVDDGLVLYLNGKEIYRWNMALPLESPLSENSKALQTLPNTTSALCITAQSLVVSNLLIGKNWLAAAVYQANDAEQDVVFGLEIDAVFYRKSPHQLTNGTPANLRMTIATNGPSNIKIGWPNTAPNIYYGYMLQQTAKLEPNKSNTVWLGVSNGTNGAVIPHSDPVRIYRMLEGPNGLSAP
jgi:hypothetical protein